jgi:hypothetical protein
MEFTYELTPVKTIFAPSNNCSNISFNQKAMTNTKTNQTAVNTSYVVSSTNGEVKNVVATKEAKAKTTVKSVAGFAKNTRYSIYNNGGGYTGL